MKLATEPNITHLCTQTAWRRMMNSYWSVRRDTTVVQHWVAMHSLWYCEDAGDYLYLLLCNKFPIATHTHTHTHIRTYTQTHIYTQTHKANIIVTVNFVTKNEYNTIAKRNSPLLAKIPNNDIWIRGLIFLQAHAISSGNKRDHWSRLSDAAMDLLGIDRGQIC